MPNAEAYTPIYQPRECIDASGITHVSPGTRRVVRFYDE
jgi:hypothetical protein